MGSLKVFIHPETLGNENNNNTTLLPFRHGFEKFFTDLKEAFDNGTNPVYLMKFAPPSDIKAIALCYALYQEKLIPTEASYNEDQLETIITINTNEETSQMCLKELSTRIKHSVLNLVFGRESDLVLIRNLNFEIKQYSMDEAPAQQEIEDIDQDAWKQVAADLDLSESNRVFPACKSCYNVKPPIVIQQEGGECRWCKASDIILLHESTHHEDDDVFVEYALIRLYNDQRIAEECNDNLGAMGHCSEGENCQYAHSPYERKIWEYVKDHQSDWDKFLSVLAQSFPQDSTTSGVFHCAVCLENFENGTVFNQHRDSMEHKQLSRCLDGKMRKWKYRQPPNLKGDHFYLCNYIEKEKVCPHGDTCSKAHSSEELQEWKNRLLIIKEKQKFAKENKLLSFSEQISQEFDEARSSVTVLTENMDEVKLSVMPHVHHVQCCPTNGIVEWIVKLNCMDTQNKLSHVALLQRDGHDYFKVCKLRGKKKGPFSFHIDYTTGTDDRNNLLHGIAKFKVKFRAVKSGTFSEALVFELRKQPRPALMVKFHVLVGDQLSVLQDRPLQSDHISWEKRHIIDFETERQNEFEEILADLTCKYKAPEVALDYKEYGSDLDSKNLTVENYVSEMHKFLYREEAARRKAISKVNCCCKIGLSADYYSLSGGLCMMNEQKGLYGIFQLPSDLTRDSDEGLLIRESCNMVLLAAKDSDSKSEVYESKIETITADHAVLHISRRCVERWELQSGQIIECDLQFQFNRGSFCMSHYALDQLPDLGRLSIVCPEPHDFPQSVRRNRRTHSDDLDESQNKVLEHLTSEDIGYPLFAVVGPFGTGKTYTISKCVLHLLENYPKTKILICTHSNSAADLYVQNNFTENGWEGKIIRVMYHDRNPKSVPDEVHPFCLKSDGRSPFRYPTTQEIINEKVRVVITTFSTALALGQLTTGLIGTFTHIFLDEAAQAMECEAIIPLTLASTNSTKVIVAGDHMQISQKVYSKKFGSESHYTLVERMYTRYRNTKKFSKNIQDSLYTFLTNNYRCVEAILYLIQHVFYKQGLLKSCTKEQPIIDVSPVQFWHIQGQCVKDFSSGGYYNAEEANLSVVVVDQLLALSKGALKETDIVVVSSYTIQVKYIRDLMRKQKKRNVKVERVRNIQGLEFKAVIMSCVHRRTSAQDTTGSKSGLLADIGLLNTAITRSKVAVIAIGDAVTLCSIGECQMRWDKYVKFCDLNASLLPRNESYQSIKFAVSKISKLNPEAHGFVPRTRTLQKTKPLATRSTNNYDASLDRKEKTESVDSWSDDEDDQSDYEHEDSLARVEDDILDDILEKQLGYRPDKIVVKVDKSGLEYLDTIKDDPNEPKPDLRGHGHRRTVIHQKFTVGQLQDLLRSQPQKYKHCFLNMKTWHSAEAILKDPEEELGKISLETRRSLGRAFNKDEVVVHVSRPPGRAVTGKVIGVLSRYKEPRSREFVCIPDQFNPMFMCPVDYKVAKFIVHRQRNIHPDFVCIYNFRNDELKFERRLKVDPNAYTRGNGQLFIVRYLNWSEYSLYPYGYVSKVIAASNAERYFAITFDRPTEHRPDMEKKGENLKDENSSIRKDCTGLYAFTIDPPGSKDLDDALSIEKCSEHKSCYEIGVHIADVASVIPFGCDVDKEARRRATTFYDPEIMQDNRKISPMLPLSLSSNKCSLLPGETRPAISTFFHTSRSLDITNTEFDVPTPQLTMIRSRRQMNYKEAEDLLRKARKNPPSDELDEISDNTLSQQLNTIWLYLLELRFSRLGTGAFHQSPDNNKLNEFFKEASAHMLIEEAMITLNACTAIFLMKEKCNFLLRCQDDPLEEEWRDWVNRYHSQIRLSLDLKSHANYLGVDEHYLQSEPISQQNLQIIPEVLRNIGDALGRGDIESALIYFSCDRLQPSICPASNGFIAMQKPANLKPSASVEGNLPTSSHSHFQLRLPFYSWCSSPIRRYTDIIAQREIVKLCKKGLDASQINGIVRLDARREKSNLNEICKQISLRQSDAKEYERELMKFSVAKLFQTQTERFYQQGVVTEVTNREIHFSLINYKGLDKSAAHLDYTPLMVKRSNSIVAEYATPPRPGEKVLESNELIWHVRYYDLAMLRPSDKLAQTLFERVIVPMRPVRELVEYVSHAIHSGSRFEGQTAERIQEHFRRVIKTQRNSPQCVNRRAGQIGPCNDRRCDFRDSTCSDHMSFRTKNDVRHVRVISMQIRAGLPLLMQLSPKIHRGMLQPTVQLLCLAEDFDLCLTHQSDPIETFAYDVKPAEVQGYYESTVDYANAWLPVLRLDGVYTAVKEAASITYSGIAIEWTKPGVEGKFVMGKRYCDERMIDILPDGFICIRVKNCLSKADAKDARFTWVAHALITKVTSKKRVYDVEKDLHVSFTICKSLLSNVTQESGVYLSDTLWTVEHIQLQAPHKRMAFSLHKVMDDLDDMGKRQREIIEMLCLEKSPEFPTIKIANERVVNKIIDSVGTKIERGFDFPLNPVQAHIVREAMKNKLSFIQGPPGTGKSLTGAYMVYYFRQMNIATGNKGLIMYCGPSNKAADVVAEYLLKCGLRTLRVYGKMMEELDFPNPLKPAVVKPLDNPSKKLDEITLHKKIRSKSNSYHMEIQHFDDWFQSASATVSLEDYRKYKSIVGSAKDEELARHDVIICTCTAAAMASLRNKTYSHCIIDEAGMCSEPETLVPVVSSRANQVVLIGDHQQLQPVIQCDRAREFGLGVSMFERLHKKAKMLTIQYRMHETICQFPSNHFYEGKLHTDRSVVERELRQPGVMEYPAGKYPRNTAIFAHIETEEDSSFNKFEHGGVNSKCNKGQARAVLHVLKWLHITKRVPLEKIMILSPYNAQCYEISNTIKEGHSHWSNKVHVGTVVTSQGSEKDYVILSTVRSPRPEEIDETAPLYWRRRYLGFITDPHQVNVAITRAKCGLCIIGNRKLLEKDEETWQPLLESYEARGSVVRFDRPTAPWNMPNRA